MADYDDYERERQLTEEYNRVVNQYNRAVEEHNVLQVEVANSQRDVATAQNIIAKLHNEVVPTMDSEVKNTDKEEVIAENIYRTIEDLAESFRLLQVRSTNSKNLTSDLNRYYTHFGLYNKLRQVSLGYIVGVDSNLWSSDVPRQTVEKMYLANTEYWLAYATMAVVLWASDEQEACERAISKSMQMNERNAALYFLLVALRFGRTDAAKEWYKVYLKIIDSAGLGTEIIYILQALLCGALGADRAFAQKVGDRIRELIEDAYKKPETKKLIKESLDNYFTKEISVTTKEYIAWKHICPRAEYDEQIDLLSAAEKTTILKERFRKLIDDDVSLSDRLGERIEDSLYSLISAYDAAEQELKDRIAYREAVSKANGREDIAKEAFNRTIKERDNKNNIALIIVDAALADELQTDARVRKFSLNVIKNDCVAAAERYVGYRKKEKKEYPFSIDGCQMKGDENSFEANKSILMNHYEKMQKEAARQDKGVKGFRNMIGVSLAAFVLLLILTICSFALDWGAGACAVFVIFTVVALGMGVFGTILMFDQIKKVKKSFEFRINNGIEMLEEGLKDLARWRADYKKEDAVGNELIKILKEEL